MMKILLFFCAVAVASGHNNKDANNDGDLQSALMPQELNPMFVADEEKPWRSVLPLPRLRRGLDVVMPAESTTIHQVKTYSRIVAGIVLALSAVVEIIVYFVEMYYV